MIIMSCPEQRRVWSIQNYKRKITINHGNGRNMFDHGLPQQRVRKKSIKVIIV